MLQSPQPSVTCSVPPGPTAAINSPTPGLVGVGTNGDNILGGGAFGASPPGATHLPAAGGGHHPHLPHSEHIMAAAAAAAAAGMHHPHHGHHPHLHPHFQGPIEPPRPRFLFRMPRVVPNQKEKYESDELMKRHSREGEIRYTAFRDRPLQERQAKFIASLREGHTEIAFMATGFNLVLAFNPAHSFDPRLRHLDWEKEPGKVHIRSPFILNGVSVRWKGYMDIERLDGVGCIEFDEEAAKVEDAILREQVEAYNRRMKEFEEHRKQQQRQIAAFMGQHQAAMAAAAAAAVSSAATSTTTTTSSPSSSYRTTSQTTEASSTSPSSTSNRLSVPAGQSMQVDSSTNGTSDSPETLPPAAPMSSPSPPQSLSSTSSPAFGGNANSSGSSSASSAKSRLSRPEDVASSSDTAAAAEERRHLELSATVVSSQH